MEYDQYIVLEMVAAEPTFVTFRWHLHSHEPLGWQRNK